MTSGKKEITLCKFAHFGSIFASIRLLCLVIGSKHALRFHQLHCVSSMRTALQDLLAGKDIGIDWHDNGHWPHCLDYLVQASEPKSLSSYNSLWLIRQVQTFLCHADDTIEREHSTTDITKQDVFGYQETRQCKATTRIYDLIEQAKRDWPLKRKDWAMGHCDNSSGTRMDSTCFALDLRLVAASKGK